MTVSPKRLLVLGTLAATLVVAAGCDKSAQAPAKADEAKADKADANAIPGLETEKKRVSYMIGLDMGQTLKQVKDEVDLPTLEKGLKAALDGTKPLIKVQQAQQVREDFARKMQR